MSKNVPIEHTLHQLRMIEYTLTSLRNLCVTARPYLNRDSPSIFAHCSMIGLDDFIKCKRNLEHLDETKRQQVEAFYPLLEELDANRSGIEKFRNNWVAHTKTRGDISETMTECHKNAGLPRDPMPYFIMADGIRLFVQALRLIFKVGSEQTFIEFCVEPKHVPPKDCLDIDAVNETLRDRINTIKADMTTRNIPFPWADYIVP